MNTRVLAAAVVTALVAAPAAVAKGPSGASIDGPGTGGGISVGGNGEGPGSPLGNLTMQSGFFAATFGQQPDPMLRERPKGELGPRYTITYTLPGPYGERFRVRQDVYPYAKPPVTYTSPGQKFFHVSGGTHGGWYVATPGLKATLLAAGLPATPEAASGDGATMAGVTAGLAVFAVVLAMAGLAMVALRRRPRGAPA